MDELQQRFVDALTAFGTNVHAVGTSQWADSTPCTDWDVRALVNHVTYETLWVPDLFAGKTVAEVGDRYDGDQLGEDPAAAWDRAEKLAAAAVSPDGAMSSTVHLSYGDVPGSSYAEELFTDLVVHAWDLARGIGADDTMNTAWAQRIYDELKPKEAELKASGLWGDTIVPPPGADIQTKLLAVMGRVQ
jgi:uncharacterized protein (TIGR03086 family)